MNPKSLLLSLAILFTLHFALSLPGGVSVMESVPDLRDAMYASVNGYPCVRLLNLSAEIGCANPGRDKVVAPIVRFNNSNGLEHPSAVLVSMDELEELLNRVSNDPNLGKNIAGVLVESQSPIRNKLKGFSPDQKFPEADFAPYQRINYAWNPIGSGIMWRAYNFPVFLLSENSINLMLEIAKNNEQTKNTYTTDVVEFDLVMQTTKSGTRNSESCLKEGTCLPLGGYSVWSSLPPINISSSNPSKPIILTITSMDSASFFRDKSLGAESPVSGLIALLAAVDSLMHLDGLNDLGKQLVFAVFTGEAWGYLGTRRFLLELDLQSETVNGLNSSLIETVVEIGSVGKVDDQGSNTFFVHTTEDSSSVNVTLDALRRAQKSFDGRNITISTPSASNPGIPPSSLMAFLKKNSSTSGIVLEDFDSAFSNKFYHSHLDDMSNINSSAIVAAASLVARALYVLASNNKGLSNSALASINVNATLVEELVDCLLNCSEDSSCELVKHYISPTGACASHYVGVIVGEPSSTPYLGYVQDISRFTWNFLADRTSYPSNNASSCSQGCSQKGEICIKEEIDGKGVCVTSTTRYIPAYSTRLKYESGIWNVLPPNTSDPMGMADPLWTESNWDAIGVRFYTVQDASFDRLILLIGIAVTVLSYLATISTKAFLIKALKRD